MDMRLRGDSARWKMTPEGTLQIAIAANAMATDRDRCRVAGMDDYVVKPLVPEELIECIASHLF